VCRVITRDENHVKAWIKIKRDLHSDLNC
jgi:hypothetical protein